MTAFRASTPGQTVGPFFGMALVYPGDSDLVPADHPMAVRLYGRVLDGVGDPVPDALVEVRQADSAGEIACVEGSLHREPTGFTGWGRCATDDDGGYGFTTVRPSGPGRAPFFALTVMARGLLDRLHTRAYLPGCPAADVALLQALEPERRETLLATDVRRGYRFDIRLQGAGETVFLDFRTGAT